VRWSQLPQLGQVLRVIVRNIATPCMYTLATASGVKLFRFLGARAIRDIARRTVKRGTRRKYQYQTSDIALKTEWISLQCDRSVRTRRGAIHVARTAHGAVSAIMYYGLHAEIRSARTDARRYSVAATQAISAARRASR